MKNILKQIFIKVELQYYQKLSSYKNNFESVSILTLGLKIKNIYNYFNII